MKYNKISGLTAVMIVGLSIGTLSVFAEEHGANYTSNGLLEFIYNDGPTSPVDPTDPNIPVSPENPTNPEGGPNPGTPGPLSIDFASSFYFGEQKISSKDEVYYADALKYKLKDGAEKVGPNYVQITDNRGNLAGWTLTVEQNGQFIDEKGHELNGAMVEFTNANVKTVSESDEPIALENVKLDPGVATLVMSAKEGAGAGTFLTRWGDEQTAGSNIKLHVPGKAVKYKTQYTTAFNWTLTDAPGK